MNDSPKLAEWILEQTTDAVIYADREGTILRWNQAACLLFGHGAAQALGQNLDMIIPQHLRAAHWAGFRAAIDSGRTRLAGRPAVTRAVHSSGDKLYVEMTFAVIKDDGGKVIGSVAIARDATQRVEQERAARSQPPAQGPGA
jgi:PAS domain S-box-containing protein